MNRLEVGRLVCSKKNVVTGSSFLESVREKYDDCFIL
jgi:hypothetical protein